MEKVRNGYYESEYLDYYKTKMWFEDIEDSPGYSTIESKIISENFDEYFKKYSLIYKRVLNGEGIVNMNKKSKNQRKNAIAMNIAHINQKRANKLLFKILETNIKRWWD
jgi:hypothetical protein